MAKCEICGKATDKDNVIKGFDVVFACDDCTGIVAVELA